MDSWQYLRTVLLLPFLLLLMVSLQRVFKTWQIDRTCCDFHQNKGLIQQKRWSPSLNISSTNDPDSFKICKTEPSHMWRSQSHLYVVEMKNTDSLLFYVTEFLWNTPLMQPCWTSELVSQVVSWSPGWCLTCSHHMQGRTGPRTRTELLPVELNMITWRDSSADGARLISLEKVWDLLSLLCPQRGPGLDLLRLYKWCWKLKQLDSLHTQFVLTADWLQWLEVHISTRWQMEGDDLFPHSNLKMKRFLWHEQVCG